MRIGILSMQRVVNHGSFWQANLLMKYFADAGHTVEFIDIIPGKQLYEYPKRSIKISKIIYYFEKVKYNIGFSRKKEEIFNAFLKNSLNCSAANYSSDYDCIIIGSDEVFNFAQPVAWGFSPQLHGAIDNDHVYSYAASFGASTYEDVDKYGVRNELIAAMSNLKHISVRDENSYSITKKLLQDAEIYRHLDPVLVGDLPVPPKQNVPKKYIIIYAYSFRFNDKKYIKKIKSFAKKNGYKIFSVGFYQTWVDKNINVDPYELLQYFANAEYIITDTFHGTIFSVRCHKKFATVIREGSMGNSQKLTSLLEDLSLKNRLLTNEADFEKILTAEIDYDSVDKILQRERQRTEEYLKMCLDEVK